MAGNSIKTEVGEKTVLTSHEPPVKPPASLDAKHEDTRII